jgi:hypothetical protein
MIFYQNLCLISISLPAKAAGRKLAERKGFEPLWGLLPHLISSQRRYDRFGTSPVKNYKVSIEPVSFS